jgi:hypothetical protein
VAGGQQQTVDVAAAQDRRVVRRTGSPADGGLHKRVFSRHRHHATCISEQLINRTCSDPMIKAELFDGRANNYLPATFPRYQVDLSAPDVRPDRQARPRQAA